jgi:uncharacterized membrane protein
MKLHKINADQIEQAITEFESVVDFELVPVITEKSSYTEHIGRMIALILFIFSVISIDYFFQDSWDSKTPYYFSAVLVSLILSVWLDKIYFINRIFISKAERSRQSHEKAQRIFFLKHLNELQRHNSLVLFISIMERKIIILPDPRLKMQGLAEMQNKLIGLLQAEFKKGEFEAGFLKAISFLKAELAPHFPKNKQNTDNEVPNKLIWWKA